MISNSDLEKAWFLFYEDMVDKNGKVHTNHK